MSAASKVSALRGERVTLAAAADAFLATSRTATPGAASRPSLRWPSPTQAIPGALG
ncbi:hypothetical protein [Nonomuraea dietziae]|uniref:hypothetical protein n=1 Tax=Nonomuraea dietziae TaxID=65515 RepID=UPI0034078324